MTDHKYAERNVKLYTVLKVLTKRAYLPLMSIYFIDVVSLSLVQVGVLGAISAISRTIIEVPSGYTSDKWSRKYTLTLAGVLGMLAMFTRIKLLSMEGAIVSVILEAAAYAFLSGTGQALLHDSLTKLKRKHEYSKVAAHAQSISLLINVLFIAIVPLTYAIDKRLPFLFGGFQYIVLITTAYFTTDLDVAEPAHTQEAPTAKGVAYIKKHTSFLIFATTAGFFGATWLSPVDFQNIVLVDVGLPAEKLGLLFAAASLVGAILGWDIARLKKWPIKHYVLLDVAVGTLTLTAFSLQNMWVIAIAFIISMSFWRYRYIIYEDHILRAYSPRYKATLLSIMQNTEQLSVALQTAALGALIGVVSLQKGMLISGICTSIIGMLFIIAVLRYIAPNISPGKMDN